MEEKTLVNLSNRLALLGVPHEVCDAVFNAMDCYATFLEFDQSGSDAGLEYELDLIKTVTEWANDR